PKLRLPAVPVESGGTLGVQARLVAVRRVVSGSDRPAGLRAVAHQQSRRAAPRACYERVPREDELLVRDVETSSGETGLRPESLEAPFVPTGHRAVTALPTGVRPSLSFI